MEGTVGKASLCWSSYISWPLIYRERHKTFCTLPMGLWSLGFRVFSRLTADKFERIGFGFFLPKAWAEGSAFGLSRRSAAKG